MVPDALKSVSAVAIASLVLTIGVRLGLHQSDAAGDLADSGSQTTQEIPPNPADFSAEELEHLQRRFGVHGPRRLLWPSCSPVASISSSLSAPTRFRDCARSNR